MINTLAQTFGKNLRHFRKDNGWTQTDLCQKLNAPPYNHHVKQNSVSNWEKGRAQPSTSIVEDLASLFGVSVPELYATSPTLSGSLKQLGVPSTGSGNQEQPSEIQRQTLESARSYIERATDQQCLTLQGILQALPANRREDKKTLED